MQQKKIPMRQCLGCREMKPKRDLIRVVHSKEGSVNLDFSGRLAGRGAYICRSAECLAKARKCRALERNFSCEIPEDVYERLGKELEDGNGG